MTEYIDFLKVWIVSPVVFVVLFSVLSNLKNSSWNYFDHYGRRNRASWIFQLLKLAKVPVQLLIVFFSLLVAVRFAPQPWRDIELVPFVLRMACFLTLGWILNQALGVVIKNKQLLPHLNLSSRALLLTFVRLAFFILTAVVILDTFGIEVRSVLISFGIGSLPIGLALQDVIRDIFNGFYLLVARPVKIGDFIRIDDQIEGQIVQIGWRNTRIQPLNKNLIVLANSKLTQGVLVNFELPSSHVVVQVDLCIPYQMDLALVERVTLEVAVQVMKEFHMDAPEFQPVWRITEWRENGIYFYVRLKAKRFQDQAALKHEFIKKIYSHYHKEKIQMPYPKMELLGLPSFDK